MNINERKQYAISVMVKGIEEVVKKNDKSIVTFDRDDFNFDDGFLLMLGDLGLDIDADKALAKLSLELLTLTKRVNVIQVLEDVVNVLLV